MARSICATSGLRLVTNDSDACSSWVCVLPVRILDIAPLISCSAINNGNAYFNSINAKLYDYFPGQVSESNGTLYFEAVINNRPYFGGNPIPYDAVRLNAVSPLILKPLYADAGILPNPEGKKLSVQFTIPKYVNDDYKDFKAQLEAEIGGSAFTDLNDEYGPYTVPYWVTYILDNDAMPAVNSGTYQIQFRYKLPGKEVYTTTRALNFVK